MLCPLNIEASYWISASGRIIVPVFLASCAVLCMLKTNAPFYLLFCNILLFYEQCAVFSFMLAASAALLYQTREIALSAVSDRLFIRFVLLAFAGGGSFGERMSFGFTPQCIKTFSKMLTLWNWLKFPARRFCRHTAVLGVMFNRQRKTFGKGRCYRHTVRNRRNTAVYFPKKSYDRLSFSFYPSDWLKSCF